MKNRKARRLAVVGMAALAALAASVVVDFMNAPFVLAQTQPPAAAGPTGKFEVAAIRPSKDCDGGATKGVSPLGRNGASSPGSLNISCASVMGLIQQAYIRYANGRLNRMDGSAPISGGPSWITSERYDVNAKAEGSASLEMMNGPMLQALLEDRLKVKMRRETKEVPVYDLTVAKSGSKLKPFKEGSCTVTTGPVPPPPGQSPSCNTMELRLKGPTMGAAEVDMRPRTIDDLSKILSRVMGRPVIDKTEITGGFDFFMEFAVDQSTPGLIPPPDAPHAAPGDPPGGPSIFTAVQEQLGLKLEPAKGPGEFLVIDRVERPSAN
jgi:uncharacterized protein (TIGR03435 family)